MPKQKKYILYHTRQYILGLWQNQENWAQILVMRFHCRIQLELIAIHLLQLLNYDEDVWLIKIFHFEVKIVLSSTRLIANILSSNIQTTRFINSIKCTELLNIVWLSKPIKTRSQNGLFLSFSFWIFHNFSIAYILTSQWEACNSWFFELPTSIEIAV